ncbi:hypothetical protein [Vibrio sp. HN007]|uniref:hypothetical protein n=1 Tax=Vibrio iocasae TaxID=3098914 RepID=UPI0035D521DB
MDKNKVLIDLLIKTGRKAKDPLLVVTFMGVGWLLIRDGIHPIEFKSWIASCYAKGFCREL